MNKLYSFKVDKIEKKELREEKEDGSVVLTYEDVSVPVGVTIKKPTVREKEHLSMIFDAAYSSAITGGIATESMMRRALLDSGGTESKLDVEYLDNIAKQAQNLQVEYDLAVKNGTSDEELDKIQEQIKSINDEYLQYREREQSIFSHSAEARAQKKTVLMSVLNLLFFEKDNGDHSYVFPGLNEEARENTYYEMAENDQATKTVEMRAFERAYVLIDGWLKGQIKSPEDFKMMDDFVLSLDASKSS